MCRRPAVIHSLWLLVMLKLVTPPLVPVWFPAANAVAPVESDLVRSPLDHDVRSPARFGMSPDPEALENVSIYSETLAALTPAIERETELDTTAGASEQPSEQVPNGETRLPFQWASSWNWERRVLTGILVGALYWWILAIVRITRFQRLLRNVEPATSDWQAHVHDLARQIGLDGPPGIWLVPGRVPPMLWAIGGAPRILVPFQLWTTMTEDERTSLLLHELAHLKRRDHWVRWLEFVVSGLYWWHPVVWWARRALREAEEQCCDAWVVWAMPQRARTYAGALLAAVEFVSGASTAPTLASATSGSGHVSCLKRRLRMIVRAKTPKGLSWAGRIAVLGVAAFVLPLAPSWAKDDGLTRTKPSSRSMLVESLQQQLMKMRAEIDLKRSQLKDLHKKSNIVVPVEAVEAAFLNHQIKSLVNWQEVVKQNLQQLKYEASQEKDPAASVDPTRVAAAKPRSGMQGESPRKAERDQLLARLSQDEKKDDNTVEKAREAAERLQEKVKDLIGKLGNELSPVAEEVRKALEQAVGEIHKSLEKENLSAEDLGKALDKSQQDLRKAFEGGGAVDKELRDAIEKARKDMQEAFNRTRQDVQSQVDSLRLRSRELTDRDRSNENLRDVEKEPDHNELESTRREIRNLEQKLRTATRRLEQLEQRESRRNSSPRRDRDAVRAKGAIPASPRPEATPEPRVNTTTPPAGALPPAAATPATPAPARNTQRGRAPGRPGAGTIRRAPQPENDQRLRELEDKMNLLLKELETLKKEKSEKESTAPNTSKTTPTTPATSSLTR
jgi:beta-lactamase regulating signal transducer with metallopeptidase domain